MDIITNIETNYWLNKQNHVCAKREQKDKEIEPITIEEPKKISHNTIDDNIETII